MACLRRHDRLSLAYAVPAWQEAAQDSPGSFAKAVYRGLNNYLPVLFLGVPYCKYSLYMP